MSNTDSLLREILERVVAVDGRLGGLDLRMARVEAALDGLRADVTALRVEVREGFRALQEQNMRERRRTDALVGSR